MIDVFTPRDFETNERLRFKRSEVSVISGSLEGRGLGIKARVIIKDKLYRVIGSACGLPNCQCDAVLKAI